jgi:hypothetical protein
MMTLPFFCLMLRICPYGMDSTLFWTHIAHLLGQFGHSVYHWEFDKVVNAIQAKSGYRVLWFTSFKACINTIMVHTGFKNPGHFKFTPKAGISQAEQAVSGTIKPATLQKSSTTQDAAPQKQGLALKDIHGALSKVLQSCWSYSIDICDAL